MTWHHQTEVAPNHKVFEFTSMFLSWYFSSPEPSAQGELLPLASVRRATCLVRRQQFALNDISSETARPRALIFGV